MDWNKTSVNQLAYEIIGAAIEVHKTIGAGLLESVYEVCLFTELTKRGYKVSRQQSISLNYKGVILDKELRSHVTHLFEKKGMKA
ncbi:MAG: GxxExxY protein [Bacteroidota bacterium]